MVTMQVAEDVKEKRVPPPGQIAILAAATKLFAEQGFDGVSMRDVARTAGVSKANIYHHFSSKEALYLAILQASASETAVLVENLASGSGDFDDRLKVFSNAYQQHLFDQHLSSRLLLREALSGDEKKGKAIADKVVGDVFRRMISILSTGQETGVIRADLDPVLCAFLLMGVNVFFFQSHGILKYFPEAGFASDADLFSAGMVDVLLNGMTNNPVAAANKEEAL
jgi:TetR/AcrR family transcriptional regulator